MEERNLTHDERKEVRAMLRGIGTARRHCIYVCDLEELDDMIKRVEERDVRGKIIAEGD